MENKNELSLISEVKSNYYCSVDMSNTENKKKIFNALEECDLLLKDCVGQVINLKDFYLEKREVPDETTGEIKTKFRTILFDENGQTYATGAYGIANSIIKLVKSFGDPRTWESPLAVEVAERNMKTGKALILKLK